MVLRPSRPQTSRVRAVAKSCSTILLMCLLATISFASCGWNSSSCRLGSFSATKDPIVVAVFRYQAATTQVPPGMTPGPAKLNKECRGVKSAHFPVELRQERRTPVRRTVGPVLRVEATAPRAPRTFFPLALRQRAKPHMRRHLVVFTESSRGQHDADRLLHALEDARRHVGLMAFRRTVDHPDVRARPAQIIAHLLEARPVEKAGDGDEADDAGFVRIRQAGRGEAARPKTFRVAQRQK